MCQSFVCGIVFLNIKQIPSCLLIKSSVMGCFYSHNDFMQGLRFHLNMYLFKAQMSHEFCRCLNQMDHWPPSQHHSSWFIGFSTGRYLRQGWPSFSSPKTQKLMNVCWRTFSACLKPAQENFRSSDSSWDVARVCLGSVEQS